MGATPAAMAGARQEIERQDREFEAAFARGDMAALAGLYTEDARLLPPGGPLVSGRAAIEQFWTGARKSFAAATLRTEHVEASGDLAYEVGSATLTPSGAGGTSPAVEVKYVVAWKRAGGRWQLTADIWNANA